MGIWTFAFLGQRSEPGWAELFGKPNILLQIAETRRGSTEKIGETAAEMATAIKTDLIPPRYQIRPGLRLHGTAKNLR